MVSPDHRFRLVLISACVLLAGAVAWSLSMGSSPVSILSLFGWGRGANEMSPHVAKMVLALRWDRLLLGILAGGSLALSGAGLQALFRNDLADPAVLGVSSGAAVCAALGLLVSGFLALSTTLVSFVMPICSIIGALVIIYFLYRLSTREDSLHLPTLLLAGIAVNALAGAIIALLLSLSNAEQMRSFAFWTLGTLSRAEWEKNMIVAGLLAIPVIYLVRSSAALNLFCLGEQAAHAVGADIRKRKTGVFISVAVITGATVAFCGVIGFVGLVVPHITRFLVGANNRKVLPLSIIIGALTIVLSDTFCRVIAAPLELPLGVVMSAVGAPFFLYLLMRSRRG